MLKKIDFIKSSFKYLAGFSVLGFVSCGRSESTASSSLSDGVEGVDFVTLYDTYAMALYFDGTMGPKTGVIKVDYILNNEDLDFEFWHGHGGKQHHFVLTKQNIADIKSLKRTSITTTEVDRHSHKLFIDPRDPKYRVPGAKPVRVPLN